MEKIDILDETGISAGVIKTKDEVHKLGLWHKAVHVWLVNNRNEILLQLRSSSKLSHPNQWDVSIAGHVSAGEDSLTSAIREATEEVGITLQKADFTFLGTVVQKSVQNNGTYINNEFNDMYLVRKDIEVDQFAFNDGEVQKVEHVSLDKLKAWIDSGSEDLVPHPEEYELLMKFLA